MSLKENWEYVLTLFYTTFLMHYDAVSQNKEFILPTPEIVIDEYINNPKIRGFVEPAIETTLKFFELYNKQVDKKN